MFISGLEVFDVAKATNTFVCAGTTITVNDDHRTEDEACFADGKRSKFLRRDDHYECSTCNEDIVAVALNF